MSRKVLIGAATLSVAGAIGALIGLGNAIWLERGQESLYPFVASRLPFSPASSPRALIVFLHGHGHRNVTKLKVRAAQIAYYARPTLDAVVVAPYCPSCDHWSIPELSKFFAARRQEFHTGSRVYVIGFSMGGYAAWQIAEALPGQVSAVVPIASGGWPGQRCGRMPVWAFHGLADDIVPPEATVEMAQDYEKCGQHPRITLLPGVGHRLKLRLVATRALFSWLEAQT